MVAIIVLGITKCSALQSARDINMRKLQQLVMQGGEAEGKARRLVGLTSRSRLLRRNTGVANNTDASRGNGM